MQTYLGHALTGQYYTCLNCGNQCAKYERERKKRNNCWKYFDS